MSLRRMAMDIVDSHVCGVMACWTCQTYSADSVSLSEFAGHVNVVVKCQINYINLTE